MCVFFNLLTTLERSIKPILQGSWHFDSSVCLNLYFHDWFINHRVRSESASPGLRVMWSFCGLICVTSCVAPAALLLRGLSSITCSLLVGDSRDDGAQPAATRLLFRSQRDKLATPWPKSWQKRHNMLYRKVISFQQPPHTFGSTLIC